MRHSASGLLEGLNQDQLAAVLHRGSDSLVLAGAGSGKTRVLTTKIAYMISEGVPPTAIMALTFTNKAAREMRERIAQLVGWQLAQFITMGTFHSVFARLLRSFANRIGFTPDFTIYDTADSKALLKIIVKEKELDDKLYTPTKLQNLISNAKNDGLEPKDMGRDRGSAFFYAMKEMPYIDKIYQEYQTRCLRSNAMDFDDLLLNTYRLLQQQPEVRQILHGRYQQILVDEYQDTNRIQERIVQLLKGEQAEVTVVGDDAQSIYSFRGAMISNIVNFQSTFHNAKLFKLTKNYRSTGAIVDVANSLIEKNSYRIPKTVEAVGDRGDKITLLAFNEAGFEAMSIASRIKRTIGRGTSPDEIAILYRTNAQSRLLEEYMRQFDIPYQIYGGLSFYDRKEVKDVVAYLRLLVNPFDDEAFRRIYNFPTRGIGPTTFDALAKVAQERELPLMSVAAQPQYLTGEVKGAGLRSIAHFVELIHYFQAEAEELPLDQLMELVVERSGIAKLYSDETVESVSRMQNIQELQSALGDLAKRREEEGQDPPTLADFVQEMALYTDRDQKNEEGPKVTLMTMHASKGLEYAHVYCVGLEEGLIPSDRSYTEEAVEEERRLLYVAITRAKEQCTLSYAQSRMLHGKTNFCMPSRFINDLDPSLLKDEMNARSDTQLGGLPPMYLHPSAKAQSPLYRSDPKEDHPRASFVRREDSEEAPKRRVTRIIRRKNTAPSPHPHPHPRSGEEHATMPSLEDFKAGDIVYHDHFGKGEIVGFEESVSGTKAVIQFERDTEPRQLLLRFAKLRK